MISMLVGTFCGCISIAVTGIGPIAGAAAGFSPEQPAASKAPTSTDTKNGSAWR
jgi:hypothetical protein